MQIQGSGWAYLSHSGVIKTIENHEVRDDIFTIDRLVGTCIYM